ncbi:hypothetical protein EJB05_19135, partial [Eragrostis curvula]
MGGDIHGSVFPYFARWRQAFGKVFLYWLGTEPFLYVADPEFLKSATAGALGKSWGKPDVFRRDRMPMFGRGLVMAEGDVWACHRNIIAPAFSATNLNHMLGLMAQNTARMIDEWTQAVAAGNTVVDVEKGVVRNAAEIIAKASFGVNKDDEAGALVFEKLQAMQAMLFQSNRLVGVPLAKLLSLRKTEVLRLYPPSPNVQRQALQEVAGIPAGTNMWVDVVAMHRDAALWGDDVNEFRPERFAKDPVQGGCRHRMGYLPFGFGGRICVGRNLTAMEYRVVLAMLLRRFHLSVAPEYRHAPKIMLSLRPSNGIQLQLTPLSNQHPPPTTTTTI